MECRLTNWSYWRISAALCVTGMLAACGGGGGDSVAPATANQTASPQAAAPVPTSPTASSKAATLTWTAPLDNIDGSVLLDLSGFKIYYGQNPSSLTSTIAVTNASISTYIVENLSAGTWYFGISAINGQGIESPLSNIASKTIG